MGHAVTGLIAKAETLEAFACKHSLHLPVDLSSGLAILPLRDTDLDSLPYGPFASNTERPDGLLSRHFLSEELSNELRAVSRGGTLMYFQTDYFGGVGTQAAVVFRDGALVFGPASAERGPINAALRLLGVRVTPPAVDEFDTVGLGRHRDTEDWLEQGRSSA
jgi:hypothetical protein